MKSTAESYLVYSKKIPEHYDTDVIRTSQVKMGVDIAAFLYKFTLIFRHSH